ncbi:DUF4188 domain-containing protein [Micromonospora sp. WMMD882]|uniref:monooxygenase family protein n=1 Tax=Micromonospora sp. WMMD882 TaxID=3015151 RepID=UPI00248AC1C7|nr:DUF4188 domain-containing protein [Micromonospora sp. WMMD882]WBB78420.1 DUF4188 domain-containing protein [Micromonospora sp. WMMD882]
MRARRRVDAFRRTVSGPPGTRASDAPAPGRHAADPDSDIALFLIGLRINRLRSLRGGLRVVTSMLRLLDDLHDDHDSGYRGHRILFGPTPREMTVLQYWASREQLLAFATDPGHRHRAAWREFERMVRSSAGGVGLWHEIYRVPRDGISSFYLDVPPLGLAAVTGLTPRGPGGRREPNWRAASHHALP